MGLLWFILGIALGIFIGGFSVIYEVSTWSIWEFRKFRNEIRDELKEFSDPPMES